MDSSEVKNLNFEEKQLWLRFNLEKMRINWTEGSDAIKISKNNIINDSLIYIFSCDLHKVFIIFFLKLLHIIRKLKFISRTKKLMMLVAF